MKHLKIVPTVGAKPKQSIFDSYVSDLMSTDLVTLYEYDSLDLSDNSLPWRKFRHIPVIDLDGKIKGLLSHRDLLNEAALSIMSPATEPKYYIKHGMPVRDVMQTHVITVRPTASLKEAAKLMLFNQLGCLPVVNENRKLVGILTEADFVAVCYGDINALRRNSNEI